MFCDYDSCQSKEIWENCKINYTIIKKLSDFYEYDGVLQKYTQNTEIFSIFKTKQKTVVNNINKENIDFLDEKYDKYQDDFKEIDSKINNLVKYDEQTIIDIDSSVEELESSSIVFKQSAAHLHNKNIYVRCKDILYYVFFFLWLSDCVTWVIQFFKLTERNPEFEEIYGKPYIYIKYGIDSLQLAESDHYYAKFPRIYHKIYSNVLTRINKMKDSLDLLGKEQKKNQK